jgi:hypothetical protein
MRAAPHTPLILAKAGIRKVPSEAFVLAPGRRFRGDERTMGQALSSPYSECSVRTASSV